VKTLSSIKITRSYQNTEDRYLDTLVESLKKVKNGRIGLDLLRISDFHFNHLKKELKDHEFTSCDGLLRELRMTKTEEELDLVEDVAYRIDHGIFGTQHHVLVRSGRSEMSLGEEIRVHCLERGLDVVGSHSVSLGASGDNAAKFWPLAPFYGIGREKHLQPGEFVRMEARYSLDGYWGVGCRLMTMGYPNVEQRKSYNELVALREVALAKIRPGVKCSDVYRAMKETASKLGTNLFDGLVFGHGIGVTDCEAPYISEADETVLCNGMVIVLRPVIKGPKDELLWTSDTVFVESKGCRVVGWYKDWREPYAANYTL
jgi:Xaa-Pro aminopeptidase